MANKKLTFEIDINASIEKVWDTMLGKETYEQWVAVFSPDTDSSYEGSWEQGSEIRFVNRDGSGMQAEVVENRLHEYVSLKHLYMLKDGAPDMEDMSDWFPAYENYAFREKDGGTAVSVELDMPEEWAEMFSELWPKALEKLKGLSEV
jgi:uncharacterized protein YndB with AHSA1/START domain